MKLVLSLLTSLGTLVAMDLLRRKDWRGWVVGLANQVLWLALIMQTQAWGLLVLTAALIVTYVRGLVEWMEDVE